MQFLRGISAFFEGVRFVLRTRGVWWRAAIPAVTALLLAAGFAAASIHFALPWAQKTFGDGLAEDLLAAMLIATAIVVSLVLALALARPLSGWALDGIVRAQRRALAPAGWADSAPEPSGFASMSQSAASSLLALAAGVPAIVALTLVAWVFPPAAIATAPLGAIVASLLLAWNLLDYPLTLQGMTPGARARWCVRHFGGVLGFGLAASVFFAIPVVGWLALPFGVAGATRLTAMHRGR